MNKNLIPNSSLLNPTQEIAAENARFMSRVYAWMAMGLLTTGLISYAIGMNEELAMSIATNRVLFWVLLIAQLGSVFYLSAMIQKISSTAALAVYGLYAALTGVTLSVIFLVYTRESIFQVFAITSFAFAGLSAFGYFTKKDLGPIGSFCTMGLFGLVGFYIISMIFPSLMTEQVQIVTSLAGLVIFSGLTAYDTQKIKAMNVIGNEGTDDDRKEAIYGALILYLDFINLFLHILRLMGNRRR